MSTTPQSNPRPSPLRIITNLLGRMRAARLTHGDCGGQMEVEILDEQTAALRNGLESNAAEAAAIDSTAGDLMAKVKAIAADGIVDPAERRWLDRAAPQFTRLAHAHNAHAAELTR